MISQGAAMAVTLAVEAPIVIGFASQWHINWLRALLAGLMASSITHPIAWWFSRQLGPTDYVFWVLMLEIIVTGLEVVILKCVLKCRWQQAFTLSLVANLASALIGVIL